MKKTLSALAVAASTGALLAEPLELGAALPTVAAVTQDGETLQLAESAKASWLLVYFYPKADTPGCTKQACSLRDAYAKLSERGVKVIGVSTDGAADQKAFADKYELPFTLLADTEGAVVNAFGVPTMPGIGLAKRQAFLFQEGELVWRDLKASTEQQAADVLAQLDKEE